jgi:heme exporter protein CcmD
MNEFLAMNGYGTYIWSAYGVSLVSILYFFIESQRKLKKVKKQTRQGFHNVP